jgi:hypothetical protein
MLSLGLIHISSRGIPLPSSSSQAPKKESASISRQLASEPHKYHVLTMSQDLTRGITAASIL